MVSGRVGQHAAVAINERAAIGQNEEERTAHDRDVGRNVEHPDARTDDIASRTGGPGDRAVGPTALHQRGCDGEWVINVERPAGPWPIGDRREFRDQFVGLGVRSIGQRTEVAADHDGFGEAVIAQPCGGLVSARVVVGEHDTARHGSRPFVPVVEDAHGAA